MIDIHTHILCDFDDGADTPEASFAMCAAALDADTRAVIATPHFMEGNYDRASKKRVYDEVEKLNEVISRERKNFTVYPGCEALISLELPQLVEAGICATLNGSQYLLVELPMYSTPLYTHDVLYELKLLGITPILAHPERYLDVINDPKSIKSYLDRGILIQINAGSIAGQRGKSVKNTALALLKQRAVHFISSDAHNMQSRKPGMKVAYQTVMKRFGKDNAELLFKKNPEKLLHNDSIDEMLPFRRRLFW